VCARSCAQLVTYPLALAKTRLQASGMPGFYTRYHGLIGCLVDTFYVDGVKGLYRGIVPNLLKAVPSISISYVVFERTKAVLMTKGWSQPQ
jgi:solute carrier family 25 phosphate transporter 23/24/25/41